MSLFGEKEEGATASKMSLFGEKEEGATASKTSLPGEKEEGATASKTSLPGEKEEGATASKTSLPGEFDSHSEARRVQQERPVSPVPSCVSMKSDQSMGIPIRFTMGDSELQKEDIHNKANRVQQERPVSPVPSCVSMKSDQSMGTPIRFTMGDSELQKEDIHNEEKRDHIICAEVKSEIKDRLRSSLKKRFQCVFEGLAKQGSPAQLNKIYTELYITEGGSGEVNNEHEVRQIETASRRPVEHEIPIKCNDIFKPLPGQDKLIRTVLTKGIAGIGKTFSVQKFILDWAEGKANQDTNFIFPLPFRELNLMKGKKLSLIELLGHFFPLMKESENMDYSNVLFVFDGLDECRLPLDFKNNESCFEVTESTSVGVLLTNLIKGNLLPSALLWITSRHAAANQIPPECFDQVTEVQGFNDLEKEEYFRKRVSDENMASRIIKHIKSSMSFYILCHIPVFCWISATVLENLLGKAESGEIPKTLTQMYIHFLSLQTTWKNLKYHGGHALGQRCDKEIIMKLGKLAFQQLEKGNLIFYEEDLRECDIDVTAASVYSGVCTQIFKEECVLYQGKVYSFVHLSIQEFLAALYVFLSFYDSNEIILIKPQPTHSKIHNPKSKDTISLTFYKSAVDKALQSENGYLDLFLRFLFGLSLASNQNLLRGLLTQRRSSTQTHQETVKYINEMIKKTPSPERCINLFYCLNELNDHSLVENIQNYIHEGSLSKSKLSPENFSALAFALLTSENKLDVFNLKKYSRSEECLLRLLPVVKAFKTALLNHCNLTEKCCQPLASVLRSSPSHLRELDLSYNTLKGPGVKLLSVGLGKPHCKLEILRLSWCCVTEEGFTSLAVALKSNPSHLRELDLDGNIPENTGIKHLSTVLEDLRCKLETLRLSDCNISERGCALLASALKSNPSHLRELDLNRNNPGDSGVRLLTVVLQKKECTLEKLRLSHGELTEKCCDALASTLISNSCLKELCLSENNLQDTGIQLLCVGLANPHCKLEILRLSGCRVTENGFAALASALRLNPCHLRELDLRNNHTGNSGVELLSEFSTTSVRF